MKKYIELNNVKFEVKKCKVELCPNYVIRTLCECYKKPSIVKQSIYNAWLEWYKEENNNFILKHFTINSYNINMFTLLCDVYNMENKFIGKIYITKTRQEFWAI